MTVTELIDHLQRYSHAPDMEVKVQCLARELPIVWVEMNPAEGVVLLGTWEE